MKRKKRTQKGPGMMPALSAVFYDIDIYKYTPDDTWPYPGENEIINAWWYIELLTRRGGGSADRYEAEFTQLHPAYQSVKNEAGW